MYKWPACLYLALVLDLCIHIIDCIGDINVDLLKIFVWHSYFLCKLEDLFGGFFQINCFYFAVLFCI